MYDSETARQFTTPYTEPSSIFLHLLHSSTRTRTVHLGCVYINYTYLGGTVAYLHQVYESETAHGSSPHRTQQSVANGIFVHLLSRICRVPRSRTRTVHLCCVYINYSYLGSTVAHFTPSVRIRDRSRLFTTPYTAICSERNFRTPAVRICRVPQVGPKFMHLCCV